MDGVVINTHHPLGDINQDPRRVSADLLELSKKCPRDALELGNSASLRVTVADGLR